MLFTSKIEIKEIGLACRIHNKKCRKNARQNYWSKVSLLRSTNNRFNEVLETIFSEHAGVADCVVGAGVVRRG